MKIRVQKVRDVKLPEKLSDSAACFDLFVPDDTYVVITPNSKGKIKLGIKTELPEGYSAEMFIRSGKASDGLILVNSVGIIDNDYRGEWVAVVFNYGHSNFPVNGGDRVLQFRLVKDIENVEVIESDVLSTTNRDNGGFGSTG